MLSSMLNRLTHFHGIQQIYRGFSAPPKMFNKIIIANRGEIACRVIRTARKLGVQTVAVFSEADKNARHVLMADEAFCIGPPPANQSYLVGRKILEVAKRTGAQGLHPGYGFLSENAEFAQLCADEGVVFIGPPINAIKAMGSKSASKEIMSNADVPVTPGYHGEDQDLNKLLEEARKIGYPVMIKAVLGGGGKGMRLVRNEKDFESALEACRREAMKSFSDDRVLLEKFIEKPRHVEVQVFGDHFGNAVYLYERDCSVQRRHQKVVEEAPAPNLSPETRMKIGEAAVAAAKAVGYVGAGTVEFLFDPKTQQFYFCEMNTRLQVEHPVTEMITGQDLVEWQLKVAAGQPLPILDQSKIPMKGHALEARIYAENPENNFLPATGKLYHLKTPLDHVGSPQDGTVRVDTGVIEGDEVTMYYDPMIAKLIVYGEDRLQALARLSKALEQYHIAGVPNNVEFLHRVVTHPRFREGTSITTAFLEEESHLMATKHNLDITQPQSGLFLATLALLLKRTKKFASSSLSSPWNGSYWRAFGEPAQTFEFSSAESNAHKVKVRVVPHRDGSYTMKIIGEIHSSGESVRVSGTLSSNGEILRAFVGDAQYQVSPVVHDDGMEGGAKIQLFSTSGPLVDDLLHRLSYRYYLPKHEIIGESSGLSDSISSPMPGTVIKVLVKKGDTVETGQSLFIVEAMKMEQEIKSPKKGVIEEIYFKAGETVGEGVLLAKISK